MGKRWLLVVLSCSSFIACRTNSGDSSSGIKEAWDADNDPLRLGAQFERTFSSLPINGETAKEPWADTYWPTYEGGIAARWQTPPLDTQDAFSYTPPTLEQLKAMPTSSVAKLSPAEKFDIMNVSYSYPTLLTERYRIDRKAQSWEGICHGWAPSALNYDEPLPITLINRDGIKVPFGASDIKGLISYYNAEIASQTSSFLGLRCEDDLNQHPELKNSPRCKGVNAGSFHVTLANLIGVQKLGFVADITRDVQVWNHPVYAYNSKVIDTRNHASPGAAPGTVKELVVESNVTIRVESVPMAESNARIKTFDKVKLYQYILELNAAGQIIGGTWLTEDQPDFLWTQTKPAFIGTWSILNDILQFSHTANGATSSVQPSPEALQAASRPEPEIIPALNEGGIVDEWISLALIDTPDSCLGFKGSAPEMIKGKCGAGAERFKLDENGIVTIKSSGKCLSIGKSQTISQRACDGKADQKWIFNQLFTKVELRQKEQPRNCIRGKSTTATSPGAYALTDCGFTPLFFEMLPDETH